MLPSGAAAKAAVQDFTAGAIYPVLVTSYETLRIVADQLAGHCDLLICDEGHRCSGVKLWAVTYHHRNARADWTTRQCRVPSAT